MFYNKVGGSCRGRRSHTTHNWHAGWSLSDAWLTWHLMGHCGIKKDSEVAEPHNIGLYVNKYRMSLAYWLVLSVPHLALKHCSLNMFTPLLWTPLWVLV